MQHSEGKDIKLYLNLLQRQFKKTEKGTYEIIFFILTTSPWNSWNPLAMGSPKKRVRTD